MRFPNKETVERIRREYSAGARVELVRMEDVQAPPVGTKGTVLGVDDTGSLLMRWDTGSGLNVVYGEDIVKKLATVTTICYGEKSANAIPRSTQSWYRDWRCAAMTQKIKEQILAIRETGLTNMFDVNMVQRLAYERDFYELVNYLEEHRKEYVRFILTGEEE